MRLTDILRASIICNTAQEIKVILRKLRNDNLVKILRIKPKFGEKCQHLNDVTVNFEYNGVMICEFQIQLQLEKVPYFLLSSHHFVYEMERVCESKDVYKLFETCTKGLNGHAMNKLTFDS